MRLSEEILQVAKARLADNTLLSEANQRRTVSDLYYSVFHAICEAFVEPIDGDVESEAYVEHYRLLYRQLDHGVAEKRCKEIAGGGKQPLEIKQFASTFVTLKKQESSGRRRPSRTLLGFSH